MDKKALHSDLYFELPRHTSIPDVDKKVIVKTTGGDKQIYLKAGKIRFKVLGKDVEAKDLKEEKDLS